ncbi:alpha/beta hydrolase [Longimonas halophila]|nr:alpha/beta fold hydrolase [Longimonas halophila]
MARPVTASHLTPLLLFLLVLAGCTGCGSIPIAEEDVFMPKPSITPATFSMDGVTLDERTIVSTTAEPDSVVLDAWWLRPDNTDATVLFFGGQGFYLVQSSGYVKTFAELPTRALMWDYRGYGKSEGAPTVAHLKQDALTVYEYVTGELGVDAERLVVHGHSLGTFMATYLANERPVGGVVLENPATNVEAWEKALLPWYLRLFVGFDFADSLRQEDNRARIASIEVPLLIVGGSDDGITPSEMAETLYDDARTSSKELVIVEGGGHNELYASDAMRTAYRSLLADVQNSVHE